MFNNLNLDVNIDLAKPEQKQEEPPEKYRQNVKVFLEKLDVRVDKIKTPTFQIIHNVVRDLILPEPGQQLRIRTQQQINLISIIIKIIETHETAEEVTIATYTLNQEALSVLLDLLRSNRIKKLSLFLASSYSFRDKAYYEHLKNTAQRLARKYDLHLVFAWLHLKITLVRCAGNYYQIEGSMNYSMNNMAEQILFENRKETYEHDYDFMRKTITEQNNKALEIIC